MADGDDAGKTTGKTHGAAAKPASGPGAEPKAAPRRRGRPKSAAGPAPDDAAPGRDGDAINATVIKKYANRRLYDTGASRYVTLEDLAAMVREGRHFTVVDAKSGEDITRPVLGQIIFEQEAKDGPSLLPTEFLRQVISYYGDGMGAVVPSYLEASMQAFERGAEDMRAEMERLGQGKMPDPGKVVEAGLEAGMAGFAAPLKLIEEQTRRNQEAFANAMRMFSPFGAMGGTMGGTMGNAMGNAMGGRPGGAASAPPSAPPSASGPGRSASGDPSGNPSGGAPAGPKRADELAILREQIAAMQRKVDDLGD